MNGTLRLSQNLNLFAAIGSQRKARVRSEMHIEKLEVARLDEFRPELMDLSRTRGLFPTDDDFGPKSAKQSIMQRAANEHAGGAILAEQSSGTRGQQVIRLLLGNSEPLLNGFLVSMIERRLGQDFRVSPQESGNAGRLLHLSHRGGFDLVILILNNIRHETIPNGADGRDLAEASLELIRSLKHNLNVPVIAMASSHWDMDPALPERAREAGACAFLSLPFHEEALNDCLQAAVRPGRMAAMLVS